MSLRLPVDGRVPRRFWRGTACSAALHACAVVALIVPGVTFRSAPTPRVTRPLPPAVKVDMRAFVAPPAVKVDMRAFVAPPPATAKAAAADRAPGAPKPTHVESKPPATSGPRVARVAPPPARMLKLAVQLRQAAATTPGYSIEDVTVDALRLFVERGWAFIVCGKPPFTDAVEVSWTVAAPVVRPVGGDLRRDAISQRALKLPPSIVAALAGEQVAGRAAGFLLLTRAADAVVLASQLAAVEAARVPLNDVVTTVGTFAISDGEFAGLRITRLELVDGGIVRLPKS